MGRWIHYHWILPRILRKAEVSWNSLASASEITDLLHSARFASGEIGYRIHLLLGRAHFAQGFRNEAWSDFLQAQLVRLPVWKRLLIQPFFRHLPKRIHDWRFRYGGMILKLAPSLPQIPHRLGMLHIRRDQEGDVGKAWEQFRTVLPLATEDPLLLEDLLLAALNRGEHTLAEQALVLLMQRHWDPRLPWDRSTPSAYLLQQGRAADALALFRSLPTLSRTEPWHWAGEARALRRLGDDNGAWASLEEGLARFPDSFRLWMERHQMAMDGERVEEARHCLHRAEVSLPLDEPSELRWEWQTRRAAFAYWVDGASLAAWDSCERFNPSPGTHARHWTWVAVSLGDFENALVRCKELWRNALGPFLLMLQGDSSGPDVGPCGS